MKVTIVPEPCGRAADYDRELVCGVTHRDVMHNGEIYSAVLRCDDCTPLGDELQSCAFTYFTDARTYEDQWELMWSLFVWNLTHAALLCAAEARGFDRALDFSHELDGR